MTFIYTQMDIKTNLEVKKAKKYMGAKFKKQLLRIYKESTDKQLILLEEEFKSWTHNYEQIDDVCVMGITDYLI